MFHGQMAQLEKHIANNPKNKLSITDKCGKRFQFATGNQHTRKYVGGKFKFMG